MPGFQEPKRVSKKALYVVLVGTVIGLLLAFVALAAPAQAQTTLGNSKMITESCRFGRNANAVGCAMVRNTFSLPPVSLVRNMAAKLYAARTDARSAADRNNAETLFEAWMDELEVARNVRPRLLGMGGSNAGLLIEEAWLVRMQACKQGASCTMLRNTGLLERSSALLRKLYPADTKGWDMLNEARSLIGNPA